jgi:hypothetical protein
LDQYEGNKKGTNYRRNEAKRDEMRTKKEDGEDQTFLRPAPMITTLEAKRPAKLKNLTNLINFPRNRRPFSRPINAS